MSSKVPMPQQVSAVFNAYPNEARAGLEILRDLIFDRATELPSIGRVTEDLRWGQPAYLTPDTGAACSLRIGTVRGGDFALFVHCQTPLIQNFVRELGVGHRVQGSRAVLFKTAQEIAAPALSILIGQALTYHLAKNDRTF